MNLSIITASLFIAGTLLSLNTTSPVDQPLAQAGLGKPDFALGQLNLNEHEDEPIPQDEQKVESKNEVEKGKEKTSAEKYVVVVKGDTLSKIAKAHKTTFKRIYDANKQIANPDVLVVGTKLRIPKVSEKLATRSIPKPQPTVRAKQPKTAAFTGQPVVSNAPAVAGGSVWDRLAACESGGNWQINTGNGYYGGLQFLPSTWRAVGGSGLPHQNSREEQIKRANILLARSGWGQWPQCARKIGML